MPSRRELLTIEAIATPAVSSKEFATLLVSGAPILTFIRNLEEEIRAREVSISTIDLTTDVGVKRAVKEQGTKQGLIRALDILFNLAEGTPEAITEETEENG